MTTTQDRMDDHSRGEQHRVLCRRCGIVTLHIVVASRNFVERLEDHDYRRTDWDDYEITQCQNCTAITFRHAHRNSEDADSEDGELFNTVLLYPPRRARPRLITSLVSVPWPLRDTYQETADALDEGKVRLPAIGLRACIEQVCMDRQVAGATLKAKIDALLTSGHITSSEADYLQTLRQDVGNPGAHDALPPTQSQLDAAIVVLESLMHRLYVLPHEATRLRRPGDH